MATNAASLTGPFWCWLPPHVTYKRAKDIDPLKPGRDGRLLPNVVPEEEPFKLDFSKAALKEELANMLGTSKEDQSKTGRAKIGMDAKLKAEFNVPGRRDRIRKMLMDELYVLPKDLKFKNYVDFITEADARDASARRGY